MWLSYWVKRHFSPTGMPEEPKIKAAYDVASASSKDVSNLVGFMISAIKNGYEAPVAKKGKRRKNGFNNFEQKEVDYDAIAAKKVRKRMDFELEEVEMG